MFKVCNIIDEYPLLHLAFRIERHMGSGYEIEMLDLATLALVLPQVLHADNGPNFITTALGR